MRDRRGQPLYQYTGATGLHAFKNGQKKDGAPERPPRRVCVPVFPRKILTISLVPINFFLTVPLKEIPNCSPEFILFPSSLEKFAHNPIFPLIKTASSLVPHNPWGAPLELARQLGGRLSVHRYESQGRLYSVRSQRCCNERI